MELIDLDQRRREVRLRLAPTKVLKFKLTNVSTNVVMLVLAIDLYFRGTCTNVRTWYTSDLAYWKYINASNVDP